MCLRHTLHVTCSNQCVAEETLTSLEANWRPFYCLQFLGGVLGSIHVLYLDKSAFGTKVTTLHCICNKCAHSKFYHMYTVGIWKLIDSCEYMYSM